MVKGKRQFLARDQVFTYRLLFIMSAQKSVYLRQGHA